ncbi:unnamed protein product [Hymenolepis diminuta]|uniref:Fibronectin type-III domain-containing protein n=1 Tax=Hymenolepis diminuta TaxID=6216 RepID=A0A0R3SM54_HYMDI|nr:unnamed protein product [Hymenolepis diminuta]
MIERLVKLGSTFPESSEIRTVLWCTHQALPDLACDIQTADSLSWEFSPINGSNETFWYKIVHPNLTVFGDCDESRSKCTASNLSAGTVYTAHLIVCFSDTANGVKICSEKSPNGVSCATSPSPPTNVQVKPNSADSEQVSIDVPIDATGIARYGVCIDGIDSLCIDLKGEGDTRSGVVGGFSPATEYLVPTRSWLGGNFTQLGSTNVSDTGWTKPICESI